MEDFTFGTVACIEKPRRVRISVVAGPNIGRDYEFDERTVCIVGRSPECGIHIPDDREHKGVSRHHCLFDINPPDVQVRDFGSLNGTFVNGEKIGQRDKTQNLEEAQKKAYPLRSLRDGDNIRLGNGTTQLRLDVESSGEEVEKEDEEPAPKVVVCCKGCGKQADFEEVQRTDGDYLCPDCKNNPSKIISRLISGATAEEDDGLLDIKGYRIVKEIGKGGCGAVYLAEREGESRPVALKVMLPVVAVDRRSREAFTQEAGLTKQVRHPNVVQLIDSGYSSGVFFFTLEYCELGNLFSLVTQNGGPLSIDESLEIILPALDGLDYIHHVELKNLDTPRQPHASATGLVHRDLKPQNVCLTKNGNGRVPKIVDLGLSKPFELAGLSGHTMSGTVAGTPSFMPRQQVINYKYAKPDVDVWAMAATLYFMLTMAIPRDFPRGMDVWMAVLQNRPVPIRDRRFSIPKRLAEVIDQALVEQPEIGIKSAAEFKSLLESAVQ